ncbi:hypothetical protein [Longimicrobium sp.]|uniref:hypothetical protein n=1 Tax=Longimicrobium sp. TaxID=2029185 RepID=UPI002E32DAB0|nr:hypothetical protein [Longimicrobium sp.]HEX6036763.1 hypothetical protein [Longimicrobium sp.]
MPRIPGRSAITRERFHAFTRELVGLPVARTWRGAGSAIFLELGTLTRETYVTRRGEHTSLRGEASLMLEWSWRVESSRAIRFGSWSTERRITHGVRALQGHTVADVAVTGRIPELVLTLDGDRWVHTFMTAEGQPAWTVFLRDGSWLGVWRGGLFHQLRPEG